jgi:hypothetical protein
MEVESFLSRIFSYFSFLVFAGSPYHGRLPRQKYIKTNPRDSRSSLRDCSTKIIIAKLTDAEVSIHRSVSSGTCEVLTITVGDVLAGLWVPETFGKAEIDDVHVMLFLPDTDEEVVGLDVTVEEVTGVHELDSLELKCG